MGSEALIIEAAVNGAWPATWKRRGTGARNPVVPATPEEIATDALACLAAGATVIHNHTDDDVLDNATGRHASEPYLAAYEAITAAHPGAICYPTMSGGGDGRRIEDRYAHIVELHDAGLLGMGVADPGSLNLVGRRRDGQVASTALPYINAPADVAWMFAWCAERDLPVHASVFEPGHLRVLLGHLEAGTLPAKTKVQFYLGGPNMLFGLPNTPWSLDVYLRLLGDAPLRWMVGAIGGDVLASGVAAAAIAAGGHVRVGWEDFSPGPGRPAQPANAELVGEVVALANQLGRTVADTPTARDLLGAPAR
ncbi:MAG: 3-keto-5-aminohexanoate cleavage protein [Acidimicrobiia bacterium]